MKFLKGLAISLLTLLLFLSLAVFSIIFSLNSTLLNPDFIVAHVDRLDISSLAREVAEEQIGGQIPSEAKFLEEALYATIADNEPWIKEQVTAAVYSGYDYFLGESEELRLTVSMEPLKESLRANLRQSLQQNLESLFPQFAAAPPAQIEQLFNQYYQAYSEKIPAEFEFDVNSLDQEVLTQIRQVRQYIGYVQTGYSALIGLMVLLILGIILLDRNVGSATRGLGITLLIYGILEFAGFFATRNFLPASVPLQGIPPSLQPWLMGLIRDSVAPLQTLSIGLMAAGAVLITISIVYRLRRG